MHAIFSTTRVAEVLTSLLSNHPNANVVVVSDQEGADAVDGRSFDCIQLTSDAQGLYDSVTVTGELINFE